MARSSAGGDGSELSCIMCVVIPSPMRRSPRRRTTGYPDRRRS
jgi:hypothetical protein